MAACQARELVYVRVGAHDGDFHIAQGARERQRVVEKTAIESGDRCGRKAGRQAGFDFAWPGCFRHDYEYTVTA